MTTTPREETRSTPRKDKKGQPMPNWCNNTLAISGDERVVQEFRKKARGRNPKYPSSPYKEAIENLLSFHQFLPVPEDVLKEEYGKAGYKWECKNWGVKWGACNVQLEGSEEGSVTYLFDTPWGPPLPWMKEVAKQYPGLEFTLEWEVDDTAGRDFFRNGRLASKTRMVTTDFEELESVDE